MSPRVAFWTSSFEARMEAVASEVALLRRHLPRSSAWGLHSSAWCRTGRRSVCLHPKLQLPFRVLTRLLEPLHDVNHVFGSLGDWHYLEGPRRRPVILTAAVDGKPVDRQLLERVSVFVAETPAGRDALIADGFGDRVRMILPPVNLDRFRPTAQPDGPFTVLFASSPDRSDWLAGRGVPQLLDAAAELADVRFRLLWRPWGDTLPTVQQWVRDRSLDNVDIVPGCVADMAAEYARSDAVIAPFTDAAQCKPAPNSLIEGLACGRPTVSTPTVGLAEIVTETACGVVAEHDGPALAEAIRRIRSEWPKFSTNARSTAERLFDERRFVDDYLRLYESVTAPGSLPVRPHAVSGAAS